MANGTFPEYELAGIETIARGVCVQNGKVLLCRAKGGATTYLPGGHIEFGEKGCAALARESLPRRERLVRDLLDGIGMPESLLGYPCLAYAAALLSTVPPPAPPLQYALDPHLARHFSVSPSAVEKRIRGAVESAWLRGSLTAQTRLLGLSVSAERGKPTNSELLYRLAESVRAALVADTNAQ